MKEIFNNVLWIIFATCGILLFANSIFISKNTTIQIIGITGICSFILGIISTTILLSRHTGETKDMYEKKWNQKFK